MDAIESALVVLVPEAEALVKPFRDEHDPAAALGIPAHVTLLYPFISPNEITVAVHDALQQCLSAFGPFSYALTEMRRFPGVIYLAPEPTDPFRDLTLALWDRYPDRPPYGGRHSDIVPHLSVAQFADEQQLDAVAEEFLRASRGACRSKPRRMRSRSWTTLRGSGRSVPGFPSEGMTRDDLRRPDPRSCDTVGAQ